MASSIQRSHNITTLKRLVRDYLEAQRPYYDEVEDSLKVLEKLNDDLSNIDSLSKVLILRLIDDNELYMAIESANIKK